MPTSTCPDFWTSAIAPFLLLCNVTCWGPQPTHLNFALGWPLMAGNTARATLGFYLSPVFAVLFGVISLGETLYASAGIGLTAIIIGSVLASRVPTSGKNRWAGQR